MSKPTNKTHTPTVPERYFVPTGTGDLPRAKRLLDARGISYEIEKWQPGVWAITVPPDAHVGDIFAP